MAVALADRDSHDYSPSRLDYWIRSWPLLESLAESPRTSRHHLQFDHANQPGPCMPAPKLRGSGKGFHGDSLDYADVRADIERAISLLPAYSLESLVVCRRLTLVERGHEADHSLAAVAKSLGRRYDDVRGAYTAALRLMAEALGWSEAQPAAAPALADA